MSKQSGLTPRSDDPNREAILAKQKGVQQPKVTETNKQKFKNK